MKNFELTIDNAVSKSYNTIEEANAVYDRAIRLIRAKQAKYDTVQMIDYIAVCDVDKSDFITYCDGSKLMDSVMRAGR